MSSIFIIIDHHCRCCSGRHASWATTFSYLLNREQIISFTTITISTIIIDYFVT